MQPRFKVGDVVRLTSPPSGTREWLTPETLPTIKFIIRRVVPAIGSDYLYQLKTIDGRRGVSTYEFRLAPWYADLKVRLIRKGVNNAKSNPAV